MTLLDDPITVSVLQSLEADMSDAVIVNINYVASSAGRRSSREGLPTAAIYAAAGQTVIITSVESEESLLQNEIFASLVKKPNVKFLRLPATLADYRAAYQSLKQ